MKHTAPSDSVDPHALDMVRGHTRYVDDLPDLEGTLHAAIVPSRWAHARLIKLDTTQAMQHAGVVAILTARDVLGKSKIGPVRQDEDLLVDTEIIHYGQALALVVADSESNAKSAAQALEIEVEILPAILDMDAARAAESFFAPPRTITRGDWQQALLTAPHRLRNEIRCGAQEHFYLETQCAYAYLRDDHSLEVWSSTQHPTGVQRTIASVLGIAEHQVICHVSRLGGGFGGKETQAENIAALAALAAWHTHRPVRLRLPRHDDMQHTGKRHPFVATYEVGYDGNGQLLALHVELLADGGCTYDLSGAILDRALFHLDNAYFVENVLFTGRVARTHLPSNTAFRGFGGPQGMLVAEAVIEAVASRLHLDPAMVRAQNFYGLAPRDHTPYGANIASWTLPAVWHELLIQSDYVKRRAAIESDNYNNHNHNNHNKNACSRDAIFRRGIGITPVKFGISFTTTLLNQAGALVLIYADGSIQLNHGATEMGQGVVRKLERIAAQIFGVELATIRTEPTSTAKIPNTSATAASSSTDLNGAALAQACHTLLDTLRDVVAKKWGCERQAVEFNAGVFRHGQSNEPTLSFAEAARLAWLTRQPLFATGHYATPEIHVDPQTMQGQPFFYYACGAAVCEVEIDLRTGQTRLLRTDIVHDVGQSLDAAIDRGQIEGGFVQGLGWVSTEEVVYGKDGKLLTIGPSTYKIPTVDDIAADFRVHLLEKSSGRAILGSKAVGEPPLMLALSYWSAVVHALQGLSSTALVPIDLPATAERVLQTITERRCIGSANTLTGAPCHATTSAVL